MVRVSFVNRNLFWEANDGGAEGASEAWRRKAPEHREE